MKIYDEITNEELTSPDLSEGYLYTARRVAEHVPESREVMQGTVTEDDPKGLEHIISGYDVYEDCQFYHAYTAEELAEREKPTLQWTPPRRPFWSWPRCWPEVNDMVQFYICCIKRGLITLDKVPEKWREAVRAEMEGA